MRLACLALLVLSVAPLASGQSVAEPLFVELPGRAVASIQASPSSAVLDSRTVGMRLERLFDLNGGVAARIELNLGDRTWIAVLERVDSDITGFRSWVGALEGVESSHVVITERDGVVSGLINAIGITYQIRTAEAGAYLLERVDPDRLARDRESRLDSVPHDAAEAVDRTAAADDGTTIDVLMLYSTAARNRAGGVAQIQSIASQAISDTNTIFGRSGIFTRVRLAGTSEFFITEATDMALDLDLVEASPTAHVLRDSVRADIVQLLVVSPDLETCGIANVLRSLNQPTFAAYSVADIVCLPNYTQSHEMGHSLGAQHAPEDGASAPLFPYSFAYKDTTHGFRTVMAYACTVGSCPKIPNFSNPAILYNGNPTGSASRNNALSINNAAATVANFRQSISSTSLDAPANLASTVSGQNVTVQWGAVPGATSYSLLVGSFPGGADQFNSAVGNTTAVSGSVGTGIYFWRVLASNGGLLSPPSVEGQFSVAPSCPLLPPPQNFQFTLVGRTVTLFWLPPLGGGPPTSYIIEAGSGTGLANLYNSPAGLARSITVGAPPGVFFVRIRAQNGCGLGAPSNERVIAVQ